MDYKGKKDMNGAETVYKKFGKFTDEQKKAFEKIKSLRKQGKYEEGKELGRKFANIPEIQSQVIKICILNGEYEEAKNIGAKFPNNHVIQSQIITIYIREGKYKEAKIIGAKFPNYSAIQSQIVTIHIRKKEYEEAKKIGAKFPDDSAIQSQMVTIYMKNGEDEKAKEIGEKFPDNPAIQFQLLTLYIRDGEYKKAKEIRDMFPENAAIQSKSAMLVQTPESILTKINNNPSDPTIKEEIEKLEDKWLKVIFNSAIADKMNIKTPAQNFIKELKRQGFVDEEHKSMIQALEQRLQQKAKIFDAEFYERLVEQILKCNSKTSHTTPNGEER